MGDYGNGSIYEKNGKWCGQKLIQGKKRTVYGKTKSEVRQKLRELEYKAHSGILLAGRDTWTVETWLGQWLQMQEEREEPLARATLISYRDTVRRYIVPHIGYIKLRQLTWEHLEELYRKLRKEGGDKGRELSTKTVALVHTLLKLSLQEALRRKLIEHNVAADARRPKVKTKEARSLTPDEIKRLLTAAATPRQQDNNSYMHALLTLAIATGARIGELRGLQWHSVSFDDCTVAVVQQRTKEGELKDGTKTGTKRSVLVSPAVMNALRQHRLWQLEARLRASEWTDEGYVFTTRYGTPLTSASVLRSLKRLLQRADLPDVSTHSIRHSSASYGLAMGESVPAVAKRLGHSTPATTMRVYAHAIPDSAKDAAARFDALLG